MPSIQLPLRTIVQLSFVYPPLPTQVMVTTIPEPYSVNTPRHKRPGFWPRWLEKSSRRLAARLALPSECELGRLRSRLSGASSGHSAPSDAPAVGTGADPRISRRPGLPPGLD